jgi:hypothetical protein
VCLVLAVCRPCSSVFVGGRGIWRGGRKLRRARVIEKVWFQQTASNVLVWTGFNGEESRDIVECICSCQQRALRQIHGDLPSSACGKRTQSLIAITADAILRYYEAEYFGGAMRPSRSLSSMIAVSRSSKAAQTLTLPDTNQQDQGARSSPATNVTALSLSLPLSLVSFRYTPSRVIGDKSRPPTSPGPKCPNRSGMVPYPLGETVYAPWFAAYTPM